MLNVMNRTRWFPTRERTVVSVALAASLLAGCECNTASTDDTGIGIDASVPPGTDAFVPPGTDANLPAVFPDAFIPPGTDAPLPPGVDAPTWGADAFSELVDAGPGSCVNVACGGRVYQCGNCLDDDGDGLGDYRDADCLGPCDNTESGFDLGIPGGDTPTCMVDCYYDQDQGPGNDGCRYDTRCDPLNPDAPDCPYDETRTGCGEAQPERCGDVCGPLVPNGCDCFGCCEYPARSGNFIFLGSTPAPGAPACSSETANNPESCHACTPQRVEGCYNGCGRCELCFGATTLPPECFPPMGPDAGPAPDAFVPSGTDAGPQPDAFSPDSGFTIDPRCPVGQTYCGLAGNDACPSNAYCITGCCVPVT